MQVFNWNLVLGFLGHWRAASYGRVPQSIDHKPAEMNGEKRRGIDFDDFKIFPSFSYRENCVGNITQC